MTSPFGDPAETIQKSRLKLQASLKAEVIMSRMYKTPAFPAGSGPDFVNAAFAVNTAMDAPSLLTQLHVIEEEAGRMRSVRWGPRTLDLDLIALGDQLFPDLETWTTWYDLPLELQGQQAPEQLILPHPRLQDRAFALVPLADLAPEWVHPILEQSVSEMIDALWGEDIAAVTAMS